MTIRRIIDLIESAADENITHRIAAEVGGGSVEGFNPYWKLTADPRVLEDMAALDHISTLIMDGFTSGIHPTWELKLIDNSEAVVDEDVLLPAGTPDVSGADVEPHREEVDEEVIDIVHAFSVVPVAETHGKGKGWYEVSKDEATHFVIEDEEGHMVEHHPTYEAARVAADIMNQNTTPADMKTFAPVEEMIDEEADEMVADEVPAADTPTRFDKAQDFVVIINAIHERGVRQQEALTELGKRGLWLSAEQKKQAGLD